MSEEILKYLLSGNLVVSITSLFLRFYLPPYLNKKGENLATKEDIADITKKIEEVKIEFACQTHALIKRRETYEKIISGMRVFIEGHSVVEQEKNQMLEAYSIAWLWANDEVLKKLNQHLTLQIERTTDENSVDQEDLKKTYMECVLEMRKNSGYFNTKLKWEDFHFIKF